MMEYLSNLVSGGGVTLWLVLASFVFPGLTLAALEWRWGHETELRGPVWAAALTPVCIALAGVSWRGVFPDGLGGTRHWDPSLGPAILTLGLTLTVVLVLLAGPATAAARRRRKPWTTDKGVA